MALDSYTKASTLYLPTKGDWNLLYDFLIKRFHHISIDEWKSRFANNKILNAEFKPLPINAPFVAGQKILYFREIDSEIEIPFQEFIIFEDENLVVADKPHFLPVTPTGKYVKETLLHRLIQTTQCHTLQPIHRIDRHTAGLVVFAKNIESRASYQNLFRDHAVFKKYEAIAPALPHHQFPMTYSSRIVQGQQFFLSCVVEGSPNAITKISVLEKHDIYWKYALEPVSGKKHQLRVQMHSLGAPLLNDAFYPIVDDELGDDWNRPLQLLAKEISFIDPCTQQVRHFVSRQKLAW